MTTLENLSTGTRVTGLCGSGTATVESVKWIGQQALKVIFRDVSGQLGERLLYRDDEPTLENSALMPVFLFSSSSGAVFERRNTVGYLMAGLMTNCQQ